MKAYPKRLLQTGICLFCSVILLFCSAPVWAVDDISSLEEKTSGLKAQLDELNSEMVKISDEVLDIEQQIESANSELLRIQDSLEEARQMEAKQYEDMKTRIQYMYENGNITLIEMLFSAKSLTDFLNKAEFIQNISNYDRNMLEKLCGIREDIAAEEAIQENERSSLVDLQEELESRRQELSEKAAATSTDLAVFSAKLEQLRIEEAKRAAEEAKRRQEEAKRKAEEERKKTEEAARLEPAVPQPDNSSITYYPPITTTTDELTLFAAILECEAHQRYDCLLAVATVILNRVESPRFGNTISEVVYAAGQFAPVRNGSLDRVLKKGPTALSYQVAQDALNGARHPDVTDCYYFLWAGSTNRKGVNIGDNLFFSSWL